MNTRYDFGDAAGGRTVYVREVKVEDLPDEIRAHTTGVGAIYALCSEDGERVALTNSRDMAFVIARENDYAPVSVH